MGPMKEKLISIAASATLPALALAPKAAEAQAPQWFTQTNVCVRWVEPNGETHQRFAQVVESRFHKDRDDLIRFPEENKVIPVKQVQFPDSCPVE